MRFGVVSDVHLGYGDDETVLSELERVTDRLVDDGAERLFVLGDLILEASTADRDAERVERLRASLEGRGAPVTYLRGNHDVANLSNGDLTALLEEPAYGVERVGGGRVVYLDSAAPRLGGSRGEVGRDGRDFLRRTLLDEPADVLLVHHPVCHLDLEGNPWFADEPERAVCGDKREVNAVLSETEGVDLVLSGHVHEPAHVRYEGTDNVIVSAFNRARPGAGLSGAYATVEFGEAIEITERADGAVRRRLTTPR